MLHKEKKIRDQEKTTSQGGAEQRKKKEQSIICYECKKSGHFKLEYLQLKKGQDRKSVV